MMYNLKYVPSPIELKEAEAVFIDFSLGVVVYVFISFFGGMRFDYQFLLLSVFFAFFPDLDFILFAVLRKRYRLVSHHFIHYPIFLIPTVATFLGFLTGSWYLPTLFVAACMAHFFHDTGDVVGIRWLWPFSPQAFTFKNWRLVRADGREGIYADLRRDLEKRGVLDEIVLRLREEKPTFRTVLLFIGACILLAFYILGR